MSIASTGKSNWLSLLNRKSAYQTNISNVTKNKTIDAASNVNNNDKTINESSGLVCINSDGDSFVLSESTPLAPLTYTTSGVCRNLTNSTYTQMSSTVVSGNTDADNIYGSLSETEFVAALTEKVMQRVYSFFNSDCSELQFESKTTKTNPPAVSAINDSFGNTAADTPAYNNDKSKK